jgi:hypothetical protein
MKGTPMAFPYSEQNANSRRRLAALTQTLTDEDLGRSTHYGWTVAALLAHLAFWDHRMSAILRRWQEEGLDASPNDMMVINEALQVICHAVEPRAAVGLAISAAEKIDAELDALTSERTKELEAHAAATETQFRMNRSLHRDGHLDDIEKLINK